MLDVAETIAEQYDKKSSVVRIWKDDPNPKYLGFSDNLWTECEDNCRFLFDFGRVPRRATRILSALAVDSSASATKAGKTKDSGQSQKIMWKSFMMGTRTYAQT